MPGPTQRPAVLDSREGLLEPEETGRHALDGMLIVYICIYTSSTTLVFLTASLDTSRPTERLNSKLWANRFADSRHVSAPSSAKQHKVLKPQHPM